MERLLLLMCNYGTVSFVVKCEGQSYIDFMSDLIKNCGGVEVVAYYSVRGHQKVLLRNDIDLENMYLVANAMSLKCVDLYVEAEHGSSITSRSIVRYREEIVHENEVLPNVTSEASTSSSIQSKTLLSYKWSLELSHVGQIFSEGMYQFRSALCKFAIDVGFKFDYVKNTKERVVAVCALKVSGCMWSIAASHSKVGSYCYIKEFVNEHTCGPIFSDTNVKRLSMNDVANLVVDEIKAKPGFSAKDIVSIFQTKYGLLIPYKKAWRAFDRAKSLIFGDEVDSYKFL